MNIGLNIKKLREKQGKSQREMAELLNVDRRTYAKWEEGATEVRSSLIPDLAEIFGVGIADLYKNTDAIETKDILRDHGKSASHAVIIITDQEAADRFLDVLNKVWKTPKSK